MDNNFNQQQVPQNQQPQQPVYQQQVPQNQQPVYQQPQQPMYQPQAPKQPSTTNTTEMLALICSAVGAIMAIIGSIFTCSCSASKSWDVETLTGLSSLVKSTSIHSTSWVCLVAIFGAVIAAVGVVLAIVALKKKDAPVKAGKIAYVAIAVGAFGVMYGILPVLTICGYNCSLNSAMK